MIVFSELNVESFGDSPAGHPLAIGWVNSYEPSRVLRDLSVLQNKLNLLAHQLAALFLRHSKTADCRSYPIRNRPEDGQRFGCRLCVDGVGRSEEKANGKNEQARVGRHCADQGLDVMPRGRRNIQ